MLNTPITVFIVITMYFSGGLVPGYLNIKSLGLIDSLWSLILPGAISTYNMIIMKTAFASVPDSLVESAQLDGAKHITILTQILVPLSVPTIAVLSPLLWRRPLERLVCSIHLSADQFEIPSSTGHA